MSTATETDEELLGVYSAAPTAPSAALEAEGWTVTVTAGGSTVTVRVLVHLELELLGASVAVTGQT